MPTVKRALDKELPAVFPFIRGGVRRGVDAAGCPVWVAYGWLRGNPRAGMVLTRPLAEGSRLVMAQLMWCLEEFDTTHLQNNELQFPGAADGKTAEEAKSSPP
jgi:hypothetical protein